MKTKITLLVIAAGSILASGTAKAQTEAYLTEFNACYNGSNAEYCHCGTNQIVNRGADAIYATQYCLEKIRGIKVKQTEIIQELESSGALQRNTEVCISVGRQRVPQLASQMNDLCACVTNKAFYGRLSRDQSFRTCSNEMGIPW